MDLNIQTLVNKISSTEVLQTLLICVLVFVLHVFFLFGLMYSLFIIISYAIGFYVFHFIINYISNIDEILSLLSNIILQKCWPSNSSDQDTEAKKNNKLLVPQNIDNALDQFLSRIIDHYVSHWYANVSVDVNFPYEVRIIIQNAVSVFYQRLSKVKTDEFILHKVLPIVLSHIQVYDKLKYEGNTSHLHIAVHSRTAELLYLQNVSKSVMNHILSDSELRCKSFSILLREILTRSLFLALSDTLCNPDVLNPLLLHYFKGYYSFLSTEDNNNVENVQLLENFVSALKLKPVHSCLRPDLATIFKDDDLREAFMRYLRILNADYKLQFCIDIEIFGDKLAKQNLEAEDLDNLYRDAWDLYSVYFSNYSPNCIKFEEDYSSILRKALSKDILKMRNTNTLSNAYNYVYMQLENYCYDFYNSSEFYFWLYGRYEPSELLRSNEILQQIDDMTTENNSGRKTVFEFGNKLNIIKDVLKPNQILEGEMHKATEGDTSLELGEDVQIAVAFNERNLNTWKVSIPAVGSRLDPITNKAYPVFVIQVQTDSGNEWLVERRPNDFHSLDMKLTEFHGSFPDAQLPPRRLISSRSESIQQYEDYVNKLIKNPVLKSSELLSTFLSSTEDFEEEEISLGKLFRKSVVPTLRKERGQNLEVFINSFIHSSRMTKYEWKDISEKKYSRKFDANTNKIYENNFDINPEISQQIFYTHVPLVNDDILKKPSTSLLYLGIRLYKIQDKITKLLLTLQSIFGGVFDQLIVHFFKRSFNRIITTSNIAYIINFIEKSVFDAEPRMHSEEVKSYLIETLNSLKSSWFYPLYVTMYENLQDAKLNKQLYYQLMDAVLEELFPELNEPSREQSS